MPLWLNEGAVDYYAINKIIMVYNKYIIRFIFEYNPEKNLMNMAKHGISFESAKQLWNDPNMLQVSSDVPDEPRFRVTGQIDSVFWTAITTMRDSGIRIISTRRARKNEIEDYYSR